MYMLAIQQFEKLKSCVFGVSKLNTSLTRSQHHIGTVQRCATENPRFI